MKKLFITLVAVTGLLILSLGLMPQPAFTQTEEVVCAQEIVVEEGDSLSLIASAVYSDALAFPVIVEATNAMAITDDSYTVIDNPNTVEVGSKLCLPSETDAQTLLQDLAAVDRVGFPEDYQETFSIFYEFDRPQNQSARVIYANEAAASAQPGQPLPYGSILAMEVHRTQKDDDGNVMLDENGRYVRDELFGLFVMRKEPGFGTKYGDRRNGEWEYTAYRPDGTVLTPPENTLACAACHVEASEGKDWVFGIDRFFGVEIPEAGENEVIVADYTFQPATLTVKAGTEVKWTSQDVVFHSITAGDGSFSGALRPSQSFSHTFEEPGEYEYFSAFYPTVKGMIVVE